MEIQKISAKLFVLSSIDLKDDIEEVSATICASVCVHLCVCIGWLAFFSRTKFRVFLNGKIETDEEVFFDIVIIIITTLCSDTLEYIE